MQTQLPGKFRVQCHASLLVCFLSTVLLLLIHTPILSSLCEQLMQLELYRHEHERMQRMTREAYLAALRRRSSSFSRGASEYRGVAK